MRAEIHFLTHGDSGHSLHTSKLCSCVFHVRCLHSLQAKSSGNSLDLCMDHTHSGPVEVTLCFRTCVLNAKGTEAQPLS